MSISTPTVAPEPTGSGAAPAAEPPTPLSAPWAGFRAQTTREHIALRVATTADMDSWLRHVAPAAACTRPIRLAGQRIAVDTRTGRVVSDVDTSRMPDSVIYKACGNRRASVCPACSQTYQRDAYQLLRAGLVGGKGIPDTVAAHPANFVTLTAPSFGHVHTRVVRKHTCSKRRRCDCRPDPCRARTGPGETGLCRHGNPSVCWARHDDENEHTPHRDRILGQPLCVDCYDHDHHVVWNLYSGELWRRTKQAAERYLVQLAETRGISPLIGLNTNGDPVELDPVQISHGKAAEMQRRAAVHFHGILRLDGVDPNDPKAIVPPPDGLRTADIEAAFRFAVAHVGFDTPPHPDRPEGWHITWGDPDKGIDIRPIAVTGADHITDEQVAGYLAKYSTKSTDATGFQSTRVTIDNIAALIEGSTEHIGRLLKACWRLGRPQQIRHVAVVPQASLHRVKTVGPQWTCPDCGTATRLKMCPVCAPICQGNLDTKPPKTAKPTSDNPYARLRRWAHMLGFGGHFLTKARRYSVTLGHLRTIRTNFRRAEENQPPLPLDAKDQAAEATTLIIGTFSFAGVGWHNTGDAMLANTSAAMARARRQAARDTLAHETGTALLARQPMAA